MDPRRARFAIMEALEKIDTPPGYAVEFDRDAVAAAESLSGAVLLFIMALLFCYMVIAAANESCTLPLLIVSVVPPSMAVPALILALSRLPFGAAEACAFVTVSGMAVNAAVLVSGGLDVTGTFGLYRSLRKNLPALGATGITTVAGALPFLFLRDANSLVKAIALITAAGVGSSCIFSLSVVPAMAKRFPSFFHMNRKGSA
jgi:multidrug efflux pump subunit AcrB